MSTENSLTRLETVIENINGSLTRLEAGQKELENKLDVKIDRLDSKMDARFFWLLGIDIMVGAALFALIAHGFHWF